MRALLTTSLLILAVLSYTHSRTLTPNLNVLRELQAKEEDPVKNPRAAPNPYKPLVVPEYTDGWKTEREDWFKEEKKRLTREKTFHGSEFNRYNRQQQWTEDRDAAMKDTNMTFHEKCLKMRDLDEQARIDIDDINAHVNYNKNMRNPANREEDRAWRIFNEKLNEEVKKRDAQLRGVKISAGPVAKPNYTPDALTKNKVKRRNLQAKECYNQQQTAQIKAVMDCWKERGDKMQGMIDLNLKFHKMEFEEFHLDSSREEDLEVVWNSNLPLHEKRDIQGILWRQYDAVKNPTKQAINNANNARNQAQNVLNGVENKCQGLVNQQRNFPWATKKGC